MNRKIAVMMGSDSDFGTMKGIIPVLQENDIDYEFRVISAHRTPLIAAEFAQKAKTDGYDLIIAGAGMSAHLPGVLAAFTGVPIIGVPIKSDSSGMDGMDALHSVIQMPPGIPVATVGIDHAEGAAKLAVKMINCYRNMHSDNHLKRTVRIVYNRNEVSEENLKKAISVLDTYGINHIILDMTDITKKEITSDRDTPYPKEVIKELSSSDNNTFVILNLAGINVEEIIKTDEYAKEIPIVEVPQKAPSNGFNDTSNKVYDQTQNSESTAFVGVNSYQNAAHIIARIVGIHDQAVYDGVVNEHAKLAAAVIEKDAKIRSEVNDGKKKM